MSGAVERDKRIILLTFITLTDTLRPTDQPPLLLVLLQSSDIEMQSKAYLRETTSSPPYAFHHNDHAVHVPIITTPRDIVTPKTSLTTNNSEDDDDNYLLG